MSRGHVYFAYHEPTGLVKIGASKNPARRLRELSIGGPGDLLLLGEVQNGGFVVESWLHEAFSEYRERGEWFRCGDGIIAFLSCWIESYPDGNAGREYACIFDALSRVFGRASRDLYERAVQLGLFDGMNEAA